MFFKFDFQTPRDMQGRIRAAARERRLAINMTQGELAEKSGVPLSSLKRFEQRGEISLAAILAIAGALDALDEFQNLFPKPPAPTLDQLESINKPRQRARRAQG